jgi:hypothetical protein
MGGALGGGGTLRTHDFECVGRGGKDGAGSKAKAAAAAAAADDVPVAPKLDLVKMRARAGGNDGCATERTINRAFQVTNAMLMTPLQSHDAAELFLA